MKLVTSILLILLVLTVGLSGQGIVDHGTTKPRPGAQIDWGNPINDGLVSWWLFHNGAGTTVTDITGRNHGIVGSGAEWQGSQFGGGLSYDGTNNGRVTVADSASLDVTNTFTVSIWFYVRVFTAWDRLVSKKDVWDSLNGWEVTLNNTNTGVFRFSGSGADITSLDCSSSSFEGRWTHAVFTVDGTSVTCFCDGKQTDTGTITAVVANSFPLLFGVQPDADVYLDGLQDDIRLYDHVITTAKVKQLFHSPYNGVLHTAERLTRWFVSPPPASKIFVIITN